MIDINLLRDDKGGNSALVKESEKKRFRDPAIVDQVIELDKEWRKALFEKEQKQKDIGALNKAIGQKKKESKGADACEEEVKQKMELEAQLPALQQVSDELEKKRDTQLCLIGNLVTDKVPVFESEDNNRQDVLKMNNVPSDYIKKVMEEQQCTLPMGFREDLLTTKCKGEVGQLEHWEIMHIISGVDLERGRKVAGHRGYFLMGELMRLNMALQNQGITFLSNKGFLPIQCPYFMKKELMSMVAELADQDETLYKIEGKGADPEEKKEKEGVKVEDNSMYMIATAEQPLCAIYSDEWLQPTELPIRFAGFSSCFRKEAGAHGKDMRGIFRIHQFEKCEMFCITDPEKSEAEHKLMVDAGMAFMDSLMLSYQSIAIVSAALNNAAAIKQDLEAWFPSQQTWRELQSCSNTTDYIARKAEIRFGQKKSGDRAKKYVHLLNGTLCATERTLCCILENYQTDKGIIVPEVLVPFIGINFIKQSENTSKMLKELHKKMNIEK